MRGRKTLLLRDAGVLLTGASSGIGRELALALAAQGARLAVVARRKDRLDDLAEQIVASGGREPHVIAADLAQPDVPAEVAATALRALGDVDVLLNNAGVNVVGWLGSDEESARSGFEINFWAPLALTAALLPAMCRAGRGMVVNTTSPMQAIPMPANGYYSASKAALAQATHALRFELRDTPIRVLEVVPGATDTPLRDLARFPWREGAVRGVPPVSAESVAAAIVRAVEGSKRRLVYPAYSLFPLEVPFVGRLVAAGIARRIDTRQAAEALQ
jgi:short-subunit dehydrogenase